MTLREKHCVPCEGGGPKLEPAAWQPLLAQVPAWSVEGERLVRRFRFRDFLGAMAFVQQMAELAEAEGHHPDFCVHYNQVDVSLWTHAIGGLSENDFILAARIDELPGGAADAQEAPHG